MNTSLPTRRLLTSLLLFSPGLLVSGYLAVRRAGIALLYKAVRLPEEQVRRDVCYVEGSNDAKHRLDLFMPNTSHWPVLVFVHGGGLASGDKALKVGGADVYGNLGRFYASRGIGVAVINYRLQPKVSWREQVADVAQAIAWVYGYIGNYGGDRERLFIGGHSAGAHLAARVALDPKPLAHAGLSRCVLSGVIAISGAGYDLTDDKTYELGHKLCHYEARFRCGDPGETWKTDASPIMHVAPGSAPFLILYAEEESRSLQRQSHLLHEALQRHGVSSRLLAVPGQNHCRIVLTLSRPDKTSAPAILAFIAGQVTGSFASCIGQQVALADELNLPPPRMDLSALSAP